MIHTVFKADRSESVFAPPNIMNGGSGRESAEFEAAAIEMGYSDPRRYAVEHELAHQIVALEQMQDHSYVIWKQAHGETPTMEDPAVAAEEHLANRLLRYINLGIDDEYGRLQAVFGAWLPAIAHKFLMIARPWLRSEIHKVKMEDPSRSHPTDPMPGPGLPSFPDE
jgi:hypothetical protein